MTQTPSEANIDKRLKSLEGKISAFSGASAQKSRLDDLSKRLDHYASIIRNTATDYYKSMLLANAGGIISVLTASSSYYAKNGTTLPVGTILYVKLMLSAFAVGMFVSVLGYLVSYIYAHNTVKKFRAALDNHLFSNVPITKFDDNSVGWRKWTFGSIAAVSFFSFFIGLAMAVCINWNFM